MGYDDVIAYIERYNISKHVMEGIPMSVFINVMLSFVGNVACHRCVDCMCVWQRSKATSGHVCQEAQPAHGDTTRH